MADLTPPESAAILDLACGDGQAAASLKSVGRRSLAGVEADPALAAKARQHLDYVLNQHIDAVGAGEFSELAFDAILCRDAFSTCRTPLEAMKKFRRWLRVDGRMVFAFPNARYHSTLSALIQDLPACETETATGGLTRVTFEKLAFRAGFVVESWEPILGDGHQEWLEEGCKADLQFPSFSVATASPQDAEDFFIESFAGRLAPLPDPQHELTTILIGFSDSLQSLRECLERVLDLTDEPVEVAVVANSSAREVNAKLGSIVDARLVKHSESHACFLSPRDALEACRGEQIAILSDRCRVTTGWLRGLLDALLDRPSNAIIGPTANFGVPPQSVPFSLKSAAEIESVAWSRRLDRRLTRVHQLDPSCVLFRSCTLNEARLLPSTSNSFGELIDGLFRHLRESDRESFVAHHVYVHRTGGSTALIHSAEHRPIESSESRPPSSRNFEQPCSVRRNEFTGNKRSGTSSWARRNASVSLCMIVRDNEDTIGACLESIRPWVDEIIVVDTGAVDRTPEICKGFDVRLFQFPWCDDFSAARNASLEHATGDWLFWMDSDDVIPEEQGRRLRELIDGQHSDSCLGYVMQVCCLSPVPGQVTVVDHVKLFRNLPELRFEHRIHEQILASIRRAGGTVAFTDIFVEHRGSCHQGDQRAQKLKRDFRILELELQERPGHPFVLFNLGMTCEDAGRYEEAVAYLQRCIEVSGVTESHVAKAWALLVSSFNAMGRSEDALFSCNEAVKLFSGDPELLFRRAVLLQSKGRHAEAESDYRAVLAHTPIDRFRSYDPAICGAKSLHNLGLLLQQQGRDVEAVEYLLEAVTQMKSFGPSWLALARSLQRLERAADVKEVGKSLAGVAVTPPSTTSIVRALGLEFEGKIREADQILMEAWEDSKDPDCLDELARMLTNSGKAERAKEILSLLDEARPGNPSTLFNLGSAMFVLGECELGLEKLREALRLHPNADHIRIRIDEMREAIARSS